LKQLNNYPNIPFEKFTVKDEYFQHYSFLHGKKHVYRVMFHVLNLGKNINDQYAATLAFCAAFIHDMERLHDGYCTEHGKWAAEYALPNFESLFLSIGVKEKDLDIIAYATKMHSLPNQNYKSGLYTTVTELLKDADGLDRVRLGDLDTNYLRFSFSEDYCFFANELFNTIEASDVQSFEEVMRIANDLIK